MFGGLFVAAIHDSDGHVFPVPCGEDEEELPEELHRFMMWEDLADFGDKDGP
jgi:hypothetical protein